MTERMTDERLDFIRDNYQDVSDLVKAFEATRAERDELQRTCILRKLHDEKVFDYEQIIKGLQQRAEIAEQRLATIERCKGIHWRGKGVHMPNTWQISDNSASPPKFVWDEDFYKTIDAASEEDIPALESATEHWNRMRQLWPPGKTCGLVDGPLNEARCEGTKKLQRYAQGVAGRYCPDPIDCPGCPDCAGKE